MQAKFDSCSGTVGNKLYRLQKHAERDVNRTIHIPIEVIYSNLRFSTELDWFYFRNSAISYSYALAICLQDWLYYDYFHINWCNEEFWPALKIDPGGWGVSFSTLNIETKTLAGHIHIYSSLIERGRWRALLTFENISYLWYITKV